jgi:tRNA1Val (adenine37-N6)-methyltransferase
VKYDFILSNPPFYDKDLSSNNSGRQLAMHSSALKLEELAEVISCNLTENGGAGILLPAHRAEAFDKAAAKFGLMPAARLQVRHTAAHPRFRTITTYVKGNVEIDPTGISNEELTIRKSGGTYTDEFMSLLRDYYL